MGSVAMTYLRGTTFNEQTIAQELTLRPEQQPWAGPLGIGWALSFAASAAQTLSPSAVRSVFANLHSRDRLLSLFGWLLLASVPVFGVLGIMNAGAAHALLPWIKPVKFAVSFATFVWTASLFLGVLRIPAWQRRLARHAMVVSIVLEMLALSGQAWRNAAVGSLNPVDYWLQQLTVAMVSVNTVVTVWLLVVFCGKRARIKIADAAQIIAIRLGLIIFLAGNAVGGYMLARGSHTVGAADGGPGLPFVNWSTIGGDLRIAHFIAIHAIQIIPVFAWIVWKMAPRPALAQRRWAVIAVSALVALAVGGTFVQAAMGHPFLAFLR
ncbi:MAG TPA: hypothetical protein VFL42_11260 [Terriglobales bacterium]|jgi:hypothetical protein|nr:hypothetical protein [Terriglobales bacterium]